MDQDIKIKVNEKLLQKTLKVDDVSKKYVDWSNDCNFTKHTEQRYCQHKSESISDFVLRKYNLENDLLFEIFLGKLHIDNFKLGPINWKHMKTEVSFFKGDKSILRKGVATECLLSVIKYAINKLDLKKIITSYYKKNAASAKVFKKSGFKIEGVKRKEFICEGKRVNSILDGYILDQ